MCDMCGTEDDHGVPPEIAAEYKAVAERVEEFDPELRNLLINETITKVKEMIETSIAEDDPLKSKTLLAVADNALNIAGLANAHNRDDEEEWTRTGDRRVSSLWNDYIGMVSKMIGNATHTVPIMAEDLPEDTRARFEEGNPTKEDIALVVQAMRDTGVDVPEGVDVIVHGAGKAEGEDTTGVGLYL